MNLRRMFILAASISIYLAITAWGPDHEPMASHDLNSITPNTVVNAVDNNLIIQGSGFNSLAPPLRVQVIGSGYGLLDATSPNDSVVFFTLPEGFPPGTHTVEVIDDNGHSDGSGLPTLTVLGPTPTPPPPNPTRTPVPTNTPEPTNFVRPIIVVYSYGPSSSPIQAGQNFDFEITFQNAGPVTATNIVTTFFPGDFEPRGTGGLQAQQSLDPSQIFRIFQPFTAKSDLATGLGLLDMKITYTDVFGNAYSDTFRLALDVVGKPSGTGSDATATPTPGVALRPQLVVSTYTTDVDTLQPGGIFTLMLTIQNVGTTTAKGVSLIVGGGSTGGGDSGTPTAGGVSGGSGEFTNFAPIGSSNVQALGDIASASSVQAQQALIVNVSTNPGAYSLRLSFTYVDEKGNRFVDDQVITLLVYSLPSLEINFYRDADPLFAGQPSTLPIQVVNLGRKSIILGSMIVKAEGAVFSNNTILVGALDTGGYFTLDATIIPSQPGPLDLVVEVSYTDDFNKQQMITQTIPVEVMEAPNFEPGEEFPTEPPPPTPETFLQVLWRIIRGLLGLGSKRQISTDGGFIPEEGFPEEVLPPDSGPVVVPVEGP